MTGRNWMGRTASYCTGFLRLTRLRLKEESDIDNFTAIASEFHSFAPLKAKEFCAVASKFRKREMVSGSQASGNVMKIANFVKFVR